MRPILSLSFMALLVIAACLESPNPATSSSAQALTSCADNCDCPYGSFCANHVCQGDFGPFPPCYCAARDCAAGQTCSGGGAGGGFCVASCSNDCDCPSRAPSCVEGTCRNDFGPFPQCYCAVRDCAQGQTCDGFCEGGTGGGGGGGDHTQD